MPPPCTNVFQGSFTIQNMLDVMTISPYCEITGDLTVKAPGMTTVSLPMLQKIDGDFSVDDNPSLTTVDLPALVSAHAVMLGSWSVPLTTVHLENLETLQARLTIQSNTLTTLSLPKLTSAGDGAAGNGLSISFTQTASINLSALTTVSPRIAAYLTTGTNLSLPSLTSSTALQIWKVGSFSAPQITQAAEVNVSQAGSVALPALKSITTFLYASEVGSFNLGNLETVAGKVTLAGAGVTAFPAPKLSTIGGALVVSATQMAALDLPALTSIGDALPPATPAPKALDFDPAGICFPAAGNVVLTQLKLPLLASLGPGNAGTLNTGYNPMLPQCRIDALKTQLQAHGWTGKVLPVPLPPDAGPSPCPAATGPCP